MPPKQATLGKFFTLPPGTKPPVKEQTKLTFSSQGESKEKKPKGKAAAKEEDEEEDEIPASSAPSNDVKVDDEGDQMMVDDVQKPAEVKSNGKKDKAKAIKTENDTEAASSSRKRKSPTREMSTLAIDEDDDNEPVTKRGRSTKKLAKIFDSDEEELLATVDTPVKKAKSKSKSPSPAAKPKPAAKATTKKAPAPAKKSIKKEAKKEKTPTPPPAASDSENSDASDAEEPINSDSDEDAVEAKVEAIKKVQKVQKTLVSSLSTAKFADWKAGDPTPYAALVHTFTQIDGTTKRLAITAYASAFFQQVLRLTPKDLLTVILLMINKLGADYAGIELGIGESLLMKAISESTGRSMDKLKAEHAKIGDLGQIAQESKGQQKTLGFTKPRTLTVHNVFDGLYKIASTKGDGAQGRKVAGIRSLLADCKGEEPKFLVRGLEGKLRLGLAEKTVLSALGQATVNYEKEKAGTTAKAEDLVAGEAMLKEVFSSLPSYEVIVPAMVEHGIMNLKDHCKLQPGVPLKPMLAKPTKAISEVLDRFEDKKFTCEYKYDGERAQIHYVSTTSPEVYASTRLAPAKGLTAIFSRNSEDLSKKYPDILAVLNKWVGPDVTSFVLDCEAVAWDTEAKKVLPFQQLMTRKKKDVKVEDVKVKVCVFAFDLLFLNGKPMVQESLVDRRKAMKESFIEVEGEFTFAISSDTDQIEEIQTLLEESVKSGCEGLMVKMLEGEESGYEPSKRSRNWLKIKKDYLSGIGDSLDLVVLGAYHGKGKRTSVFGAFLLACYNPSTETYETICNIGTGFSDEVLASLHALLSPLIITKQKKYYNHSTVAKDQPDVWFDAKIVWEVLCADLTLSPRYKAAAENVGENGKGVSLRFPRFLRERDDKKAESATTSRQVAEMYRAQDSVSGQGKGGKGVDDDWDY